MLCAPSRICHCALSSGIRFMFCIFRDWRYWRRRDEGRCSRRRRTRGWCGKNLVWAWGIRFGKPSSLRCASALLADCKVLQGCLCQTALCALNPVTSNEDEILPWKKNTSLDALNEPLRSNNFHMLELADLCWGKGTSNNVRAIRSDHISEASVMRELYYEHKGLFIKIGMVDPPMLNNYLAQFLDRGLCPTVNLMALNTQINGKERAGLRE